MNLKLSQSILYCINNSPHFPFWYTAEHNFPNNLALILLVFINFNLFNSSKSLLLIFNNISELLFIIYFFFHNKIFANLHFTVIHSHNLNKYLKWILLNKMTYCRTLRKLPYSLT